MATPSNHNTIDKTTIGRDWDRLPVEVISMIIGHLDRDDLKNCRLVDNCTGLQATCRLFRAIHIWPTTRSGEVAGKVNNPKLSGFVRCLEWHWNPLVCRCHFVYLCCMYNGIDYFKSFGHPYMRDLLQSLSRPNALCYTNGRIEKSDGACNLHGSLPQGGGLRAPPPRSRVERLLNTILVNLSVTETAGSPYVAHEKPALCKESKFKVIFETRDRDHSLTLLFHAPKIDGRWNVARLFQTLGGLQKLLPSVEDLVLGFGAMTVEHQLYLYSESSMMGTMSRYLMSRSFSRLKNLTLGKVITTEDELWQFIVRHRETLNSLTFRNVCLSQDVSTGAFNGAAPKVGIVKLLREETQFKDLAFHDEGTIHARRGGHVDV
ncbi:hypothetical protein PV05_00607 [Exophiala xenobiotica]|uniref:Uncharacterized protein n=1 Tax=Exophiala xenobiotica TaxID=348802 RepID=A0A0D2F0C5_9EURO|nr:uncharacterized protein PV05_00607 [Exophiala xenobiotica]KIW60390.1 hypothetical protein PV05_00607 [Exophiala xenobiotica]